MIVEFKEEGATSWTPAPTPTLLSGSTGAFQASNWETQLPGSDAYRDRATVDVKWRVRYVGSSFFGCPNSANPGQVEKNARYVVGTADQQQPVIGDAGTWAVGGDSQQKIAQTVTAGFAGTLTEVQLPVQCAAGADLVLTIEGVNAAGTPNGTVRSTQTFAGSELPVFSPAPASFRTFSLSTPVSLASGEQFAIVLASTGLDCGIFQGPTGESYLSGNGYFDARPNVVGRWFCFCSQAAGAYDIPFRTIMTR